MFFRKKSESTTTKQNELVLSVIEKVKYIELQMISYIINKQGVVIDEKLSKDFEQTFTNTIFSELKLNTKFNINNWSKSTYKEAEKLADSEEFRITDLRKDTMERRKIAAISRRNKIENKGLYSKKQRKKIKWSEKLENIKEIERIPYESSKIYTKELEESSDAKRGKQQI